MSEQHTASCNTVGDVADALYRAAQEQAAKACLKFPQPNPLCAALTEEVGELVQAVLHIREGKPGASHDRVFEEAAQVIAMCLRLVTEGDHTLGVKFNE